MLKRRNRIPVYVRIEPPIKWPLWFNNDIIDNEEAAPLTQELKAAGHELEAEFVAATDWCTTKDCYFWLTPEAFAKFCVSAETFCRNLSVELGEGYEVSAVTGAVSKSGHAHMAKSHRLKKSERVWREHSCLP